MSFFNQFERNYFSAQEADGAEMEEEISQDKPESRNTIPSSRGLTTNSDQSNQNGPI